MVPLSELKTKAAQSRVDISVLERDYVVISWILRSIFDDLMLSEALVFKGGTALRKMYFPSYRFSEDLDFTMVKPLTELSEDQIRTRLENACRSIFAESGVELTLADFKRTRDEIGEEAFEGKVQYVGPRRHRAGNPPRVKLDMTLYEKVLLEPRTIPLIHPYSDADDCCAAVSVYRLEEIVAEKLRAILQRTRSRDVYDVWYLLKYHKDALDLATVKDVFKKKCEYKNVDFRGIQDFFKPELIESHKLAWEPSIRRQVANLPPFKEVEADLPGLLDDLR